MENKKLQHGVAASLSSEEKDLLVSVARDLHIPYCLIMRRLIRHILDGKIDWMGLFKKTNELALKGENVEKTEIVRTHLSPEAYVAFANLAEEWGSTTSIVLRRLILLYVAGQIQRGEIWR